MTTIEYAKITSGDDRLSILHPDQYESLYEEPDLYFDCVISYSSLEHAGLAMHQDPPVLVRGLRSHDLPLGTRELIFVVRLKVSKDAIPRSHAAAARRESVSVRPKATMP